MIPADNALSRTFEAFYFFGAKLLMFAAHFAVHTLPPPPERRWFKLGTHQPDNTAFGQPELIFNRFKRRTVFPRHFNNTVRFRRSKRKVCHSCFWKTSQQRKSHLQEMANDLFLFQK